jgi:hypothetical protein
MVKPIVFVSSTIKDLRDLRSALRYWFEENGFEVRTSETADFPHPLDREAATASLAGIDNADIYVLIVGYRAGATTKGGISVTRAELRHARDLKRSSGVRPRMLTLVRSDVLTLYRNAPVEPPVESDDWQAVTDLIDEASTAETDDEANWIQGFASFREVTDALRATLGLRGPLPRMVAAANLLDELRWNARLLIKVAPGSMPRPITMLKDGDFPAIPDDLTSSITLEHITAQKIVYLAMALPPPGVLRAAALQEALTGGLFLEYDPATSTLVSGSAVESLRALQAAMQQFEGTAEVFRTDKAVVGDRARVLAAAQRDRPGSSAQISGYTARWIWALHSDVENLLKLWRALYSYLDGTTESIERLPGTARVGDAEVQREVDSEQMSDALADWWFRDSKWPEPELDRTAGSSVA